VTEVELGSMSQDKGEYVEDMADKLVTNFVLAFASGAEKIFHPSIMKKAGESEKQDTYNALQTIVDKLNYFESVEKIADSQYKFTIDSDTVYVLWGKGAVPEEISGQVKMTDVSGTETVLNSEDLSLTESPIFVEII
jgi:hypothetical protein